MSQNPTENLRRGRRRIEEIPEIILLKDWTWDVVTKRFYLHIRVCLDHDGKDIPRVTEWFVTAETVYPFGTIAIYPSCKNSITNTFPHQSINAFEEENHLWRKGKLCVDLIDQTLGIRVPEKEPFTVDERLFWNMLAFVTGVPGAGKTYLGLQYVYESFQAEKQVHSVYLSGNGPLVKVLSSALGSHVFVKDLHKQIDEFVRYQAKDFHQNIIVFDEGQRAWTQERMAQRNPGRQCSEAELMLQLAEARLPWCVLLVLIGEGQEIYKGESAGVDQWVTAISRTQQAWEIVAPSKLTVSFEPVQTMCHLHARDQLDLNVSLRNHLAQDASTFINHLISGEINQAKSLVPSLKSAGYTMLVTQDLDAAKAYCTTRYKGQTSKRYGLLVSSKAETALMRRYGVDNSYEATSMRNMDIAAWYNDPPESPKSCCSFRQVVTEFSCQGLEVDLPILCWGPDMIWNGNAWNLYRPMQSADSNDNRYRVNSYRVLLTRGRDGLLVFVPPESKLFPIYDLLRRVGLEEL